MKILIRVFCSAKKGTATKSNRITNPQDRESHKRLNVPRANSELKRGSERVHSHRVVLETANWLIQRNIAANKGREEPLVAQTASILIRNAFWEPENTNWGEETTNRLIKRGNDAYKRAAGIGRRGERFGAQYVLRARALVDPTPIGKSVTHNFPISAYFAFYPPVI